MYLSITKKKRAPLMINKYLTHLAPNPFSAMSFACFRSVAYLREVFVAFLDVLRRHFEVVVDSVHNCALLHDDVVHLSHHARQLLDVVYDPVDLFRLVILLHGVVCLGLGRQR